ncbi:MULTISPECIES: lipopolysaccharide transport periplasmic protein LptA [Ramlibacter]|uniref:Lipopolysaccharide export system protein LptA n=1 Tax=Ramlibacter pinisoli TaxID=2682844 RepID=A0A6N8IVA1_9BURK|nr:MULTISPECIES: lipopolysaccharide transport periplasmic protein LptA [Ramlibacter]MBA2965666.1 lipopolysaccharide transport periplasmic protein LptA [Ramlibacter sp. CGMCC 1.13660]MVQ30632.1 lipopolysaccharide transport periplasmic protein LptA [Ramlibacter pinisoli]
MRSTLVAVLLAFAAAAPGLLHAEKADRDKPMNIESDALRYDDLRQASVFTGRVVLTKGTILIRGARLDVRQDPEGYQYGVVTAAPGQRAFYRQKREGLDEFIEGEGEVIEYDGKADRVKFIRRAEMRRYRGATLADEMAGSLITYENTTDVFTVDGGPASPTPGGRVRAVLAPRESASAPAAPRTPATPPAQLRSSPGLRGEAQ